MRLRSGRRANFLAGIAPISTPSNAIVYGTRLVTIGARTQTVTKRLEERRDARDFDVFGWVGEEGGKRRRARSERKREKERAEHGCATWVWKINE